MPGICLTPTDRAALLDHYRRVGPAIRVLGVGQAGEGRGDLLHGRRDAPQERRDPDGDRRVRPGPGQRQRPGDGRPTRPAARVGRGRGPGYWSSRARDELARAGVTFLAPDQSRKTDPGPAQSRRLSRDRRVIETAFGQLAGRYRAKRTWARDLWHLSHRVIRKVLSHTVAVGLNVARCRPALDFDGLIAG